MTDPKQAAMPPYWARARDDILAASFAQRERAAKAWAQCSESLRRSKLLLQESAALLAELRAERQARGKGLMSRE